MLCNDARMIKYQHVIPSEALITKDYIHFCRVIIDEYNEAKSMVNRLNQRLELEKKSLISNAAELNERDKQATRNYISRIEKDIEKWTKVRDLLQRLKNSDKRMMRIFCTKNTK